MAGKAFRRLRVLRRSRRMPWFTWRSALPYVVPSWVRRLLGPRLVRSWQEDGLVLVRLSSGEVLATPPGCPDPVLAAFSQHEFAYYIDLFEARNAITPGNVVIDAGAGFGTFTLLASRLVGPSGRVVAVEPVPDSLAALERTVKANGLDNVTVVPDALAAQEGSITIHMASGAYSGASACDGVAPHGETVRAYQVRATTLDALVTDLGLPKVDFIKMNLEGMEEAALRGGAETLRRHAPLLALSAAHLPEDRDRLPSVLRELQPSYVTVLSTAGGASREHPVLLAAPNGEWCEGGSPFADR